MAVRDLPIVGDSFNVGFRFQRYWDTPMANAFFSCEAGAGLFFVSMFVGYIPGMILGIVAGVGLKAFFHLTHMGVPYRSWRAAIRPDRSWTSRGVLGIAVLVVFGVAHIAILQYGLAVAWGLPGFVTDLVKFGAGVGAVSCMCYQGFAMSHSNAISLWATGLMPVSSFVYALTSGVLLTLALAFNGHLAEQAGLREMLVTVGLFSCFALVAVLLSLLHASRHGSPGAQKSFDLLTTSLYAKWFYSLIWAVGIVVPVLVLWLAPTYTLVLVAALGVLIGHYAFRVLIFKAGVYEPIMSFRP